MNRRDSKVGNPAASKVGSKAARPEAKAARALPGQLIRRAAVPREQPERLRNRGQASLADKVEQAVTPQRVVRRRQAVPAGSATTAVLQARRGTRAREALAALPAALQGVLRRAQAALAAAR